MNQRGFIRLIAGLACAGMGLLIALLTLTNVSAAVRTNGHLQARPPEAALDAETPAPIDRVPRLERAIDLSACSDAWTIKTVDASGNVGTPTSLGLEPSWPYTPHIAYRDGPNDRLKHAWLGGSTWVTETVDSGGGTIGLALVPVYPYTPCVAYHDYWDWSLKYACRDATGWDVMTVHKGMRLGQGGTPLALEPTYPYGPHTAAFNPWGTLRTLYYIRLNGTTWFSGTWTSERVEPVLSEAGTHTSLALGSTYPFTPHISYYDGANGDLKHAWLSGGTWYTETVDSEGDVGRYTSIALDSTGHPHVSYFDDTHNTVKYAWLQGTNWLSETVDEIGQPPFATGYTSLELDRADVPYISYYDANNGDLKLAHSDGSAWIIQIVDSVGNVGQFSSLALDGYGCPHISYYDATNEDLKYAYLAGPRFYFPIIMRSYAHP